MNQQQWQPPSRSPGGGGSVRRARERMEAGLPPEDFPAQTLTPQLAKAQRLYEAPRMANPSNPPNRPRPPMPPVLAESRNGQGPIGVAISRPTQVPQWPLSAAIEGTPDPRTNRQYQPPPGRGVAPQRPRRPSHVPSMLDASQLQGPMPSFQYQPPQPERREEDDIISPVLASPNTQSSRPSTISSVGSIPDFPVPQAGPQSGPPRRSANLGPPPTSRRGASAYYSQASFVSPIPEESPRANMSHNSYASSAAMPESWGSQDSPGYDEEDDIYSPRQPFRSEKIEEMREVESRESNDMDDNDGQGLIRSASVGKRAKPAMITTRSSEKVSAMRPAPMPQQIPKLEKMGVVSAGVAPLNVAKARDGPRETVWPVIGNADSPLATGTGYIESTSSSEETVPTIARAMTTTEPSPTYQPDRRASAMLEAYQGASTLQPITSPVLRTPSPGYSRFSAIRRPPRLNMDAVRDAEARGSLTSLPDLIRRATRLAAMMDSGKRPGSRLALDDFPVDGDWGRDKEMESADGKHRSSRLSGMLAAFPPPGIATPDAVGSPARPVSSWPAAYDVNDSTLDDANKPKKQRRCCGLPCWAFFLILLILAVIIAAAVVVPLELLVFHKPSSSTSKVTTVASCSANATTACQNGGTSFLDGNSCACICTNGFTGATCTSKNATGCATTTLSGIEGSVTLGDAISRLIDGADSNFSIPLNANTILARFNSLNQSCGAENALVTFDGSAERFGNANDVVNSAAATSSESSAPTATPVIQARDESSIYLTTGSPTSSYYNGYDHPPTSAPASYSYTTSSSSQPTATSSPSSSYATSTSTSSSTSSPSPSATSIFVPTQTTLDFCRVAILFILQEVSLNTAISSQATLQHFFTQASDGDTSCNYNAAQNLTLFNGGTIDLIDFRLDLGSGVIGGKNTSLYGRSISTDVVGTGKRAKLWNVHGLR